METEQVPAEDEAVRVRERMQGLLAAVVTIAGDLSLEAVLNHVVHSACQLVGAQYAALGVLEDDQQGLMHFITAGIDDDTARKIGTNPVGLGVLGLLNRDPKPLRLHDLRRHPDAYGFPENHPPMASFLGVPIRVRNVVFGNLYLTEKQGGGDFTDEDEELAVALAAAAGVAIENARLFEDARRRQQWRQASMDVTGNMMMTVLDAPVDGLHLVAERALAESGAALAILGFPAGDGDAVYCAAAAGTQADDVAGRTLSIASPLITEVLRIGKSKVIPDAGGILDAQGVAGLGPVLAAALGPPGKDQGLLLLAREAGGEGFVQTDVEMTAVFGSHVALALELSRANGLREQLAVFKDRDRIARDLHDVVIQRLFAAGLSMQSLRRFTPEPAALERIGAVTGELDGTIRELRNTIYSLRDAAEQEVLSSRILRVVREGAKSVAFTPRLKLSGAIDLNIPQSVGEHLLAVVTEGLSNAIRHSGADSIDVSVTVDTNGLELVISDNGCGFDDGGSRSGLANLEHRARLLDGKFDIDSAAGKGTRLRWSVPLGAPG
ncbi:GAF domain-containing sensor histidine kinase [Arthrobacter monumenti]